MNQDITLSIVTPTYNRGELLRNCFLSLQKQTDPRFEWIIVDDGSTDNTEQIVSQFVTEAPDMQIVYVKKPNGGKHTALNASHEYIRRKYVMTLDSDDSLLPNAVETVLKYWDEYQKDTRIGMVIFLRGDPEGNPRAYAEKEGIPGDYRKLKRICVTSSDCCEVIRTDLFLQYPFPVFEQERFMSEGVLWRRVAMTHKCVYINQVIYICEYLDGGLTRSGRRMRIRNPRGGMMNSLIGMYKGNPLHIRTKSGLLYVCYGSFAGESVRAILRGAKPNRFLALLCLLPGRVLYTLWKNRYLNQS